MPPPFAGSKISPACTSSRASLAAWLPRGVAVLAARTGTTAPASEARPANTLAWGPGGSRQVRVDRVGIVTLLRVHKGEALAGGELRIELTPQGGDWVLVTDAWSFAEGEAERWSRARYGEFRVDEAGRALLVGLRGADLEKL